MRYSCESDCDALCYGGFPKRWFSQIMLKKLFQIDPVCQRFKKGDGTTGLSQKYFI